MGQNINAFLNMAIPPLILKYILIPGSVRACSGISPAFAIIARHYGFDAYVVQVPGHFINVVLTDQGPIEVDLSYIQFSLSAYPSRKELNNTLLAVAKDPMRAVKIQEYEGSIERLVESNFPEDMIQEELESFDIDLEEVALLKEKDPDTIELYLETGGFWAPEFGDDMD